METIDCGHCDETFARKDALGVWVYGGGIVVCPACFAGFHAAETREDKPRGYFRVTDWVPSPGEIATIEARGDALFREIRRKK